MIPLNIWAGSEVGSEGLPLLFFISCFDTRTATEVGVSQFD